MNYALVAIIVLICLILCYSTRIIPTAAASLLGAAAMIALNLITVDECIAYFVSDVVLLQIGVMIIGLAFFEVGLADDVGKLISKKFTKDEKALLILILMLTIVVSAFLSNTATVAMLIPIIAAIESSSNGRQNRQTFLMGIGFAAVLGGNITIFGSTPQMAVQSILSDSSVGTIGAFEMASAAIPLALLLPMFYYVIGDKMQRKNTVKFEHNDSKVVTARTVPTYKKTLVLLIYSGCIVFFIGGWLPIGITAVLGALLCVILRCINEKSALKGVDWTTIIMLGGVLAFSAGFTNSGAGEEIVNCLVTILGSSTSSLLLFAILVVTGVLLTSVISNTAVAAMLTPIGISMAIQSGSNPKTFAIGAILAASISFCTPIATPCVTMTMSAGYKFSDYFRIGGLFSILATVYIVFVVPLIYGL